MTAERDALEALRRRLALIQDDLRDVDRAEAGRVAGQEEVQHIGYLLSAVAELQRCEQWLSARIRDLDRGSAEPAQEYVWLPLTWGDVRPGDMIRVPNVPGTECVVEGVIVTEWNVLPGVQQPLGTVLGPKEYFRYPADGVGKWSGLTITIRPGLDGSGAARKIGAPDRRILLTDAVEVYLPAPEAAAVKVWAGDGS